MKTKTIAQLVSMLVAGAIFLPVTAQASLCDAQTKVLLERSSKELSPQLTAGQLEQLRQISLDLCQSRSAAQGEAAEPPKGFDDWFSYFMLSKQPDKAGNKRLKSLKR